MGVENAARYLSPPLKCHARVAVSLQHDPTKRPAESGGRVGGRRQVERAEGRGMKGDWKGHRGNNSEAGEWSMQGPREKCKQKCKIARRYTPTA